MMISTTTATLPITGPTISVAEEISLSKMIAIRVIVTVKAQQEDQVIMLL